MFCEIPSYGWMRSNCLEKSNSIKLELLFYLCPISCKLMVKSTLGRCFLQQGQKSWSELMFYFCKEKEKLGIILPLYNTAYSVLVNAIKSQ